MIFLNLNGSMAKKPLLLIVLHPPSKFGLRRIQCLHETGQAGARYGVELYNQEIKFIHVPGRSHISKGHIDFWLKNVDLVVNGAEQPPELRGVSFLISNQHLKELIPDQSVVIDLVSGSASNRSLVEAVVSCSFLDRALFCAGWRHRVGFL